MTVGWFLRCLIHSLCAGNGWFLTIVTGWFHMYAYVYIYIYYIFIHIILYFHVKHDESRRQTKSNVLHTIDILRWEKRSSPHPPIFLQVCLHCDHWRNPQVHSNRWFISSYARCPTISLSSCCCCGGGPNLLARRRWFDGFHHSTGGCLWHHDSHMVDLVQWDA